MKIVVRQSGNSIAVEGSDFTLRFDVEGTDLPPVDPGFAAWVLLPLMMRRGTAKMSPSPFSVPKPIL